MPIFLFRKNGYSCQIETSGTHEVRCSHTTWVTVSPKVNMRGGYDVLSQALERADEIKHPVGRVRDIEALDELLATLTDEKQRVKMRRACVSTPASPATGACRCRRTSI